MLAAHGEWVKKETLAITLEVATRRDRTRPPKPGARRRDSLPAGTDREKLKVNGLPVTVEVAKA